MTLPSPPLASMPFSGVTSPVLSLPRLLISGLSGGSGKTTVSLGLARYFANTMISRDAPPPAIKAHPRPLEQPWETTLALMNAPRPVQTFKKGPDYIDAAWLGLAARCVTRTLDPFFSCPDALRHHFLRGCINASFALIEGNRGLYDGVDSLGACSSAHLAKTLDTPILLVVDCTKMTRTVAALVLGCVLFDKNVTIGGVILNRLGTSRQENIIRESLARYTDVPVLGALPRMRTPLLPERSMGLAAIGEDSSEKLDVLCRFITEHVDTKGIWALANTPGNDITPPMPNQAMQDSEACTPDFMPQIPSGPLVRPLSTPSCDILPSVSPATTGPLTTTVTTTVTSTAPDPSTSPATTLATNTDTGTSTDADTGPRTSPVTSSTPDPVIGYVYDEAVWFYYAENLEALYTAGARLKRLSLFAPQGWDHIDGLYVGGGQIDGHASQISVSPQLALIRALAEQGLPIYFEGSALAIACREFIIQGASYAMAGIFDGAMTLDTRPQGLGYTQALTTKRTPYFAVGESVVGHQFNFLRFQASTLPSAYLKLVKGQGLFTTPSHNNEFVHHDGLVYKNTCASLTHIFAPAIENWAPRFVAQCASWRSVTEQAATK